ncbi:IscS subfamily cysteine desulfurase [Paenibacillus sp. BSR1-1]|uniref:IscS subfamily cysteine desulfurase n=1 Tax=Paenibacillus sp. BSR1-1 TaxID=3020845 RepID=UPI0025B0006A|nr:IscS subfamily cysteine desulfurase [Paenibacillus sp. BSR1-1]MDN3020202.1 IscS subfamily cysteine desulfurase [Paenibacillus sp. BSR1-1]
MIYFDFAATTPLDKDAAEVYLKVATEYYGNASSLHDIGGQSSALLDNCREELAQILGVDKKGLFFTSGATEGNFLALEALLSAPLKKGNHIIAGMAEHSSIHGELRRLEKAGYEITLLPFDGPGLIDIQKLANEIKPETILVAVQHVNSEIGTIQPVEAVAEICKAHQIHFHSDCVQAFGKMDLKSITPLVSSISFSGHKIYGPKGIGGVYINPRIHWDPFFPGGSHESGFRPGTVNVPAIAGMTVAAQKIIGQISSNHDTFTLLRNTFIEALTPIKDRVVVYGTDEAESQLPNIIGLRISGIEGQWMMLECNRLGFAISTGSACQIGMQSPAKVTQALRLSTEEAKQFIRISFGKSTTVEEVLQLAKSIVKIVQEF